MLDASRIKLYVQPAYNYKSKKIEYAEVLIREYKGIDSVEHILNFVESVGIEKQFDIDVLEETLNIINKYPKLEYPLGVNLCPGTLKIKNVANEIISIIEENNINGTEIIIEINERTDFKSREVRANINKLKSYGIRIALDDFGVDGANFYSLLNCNIDILKVDKAFIESTRAEYEESQFKILRRLLDICNDFNLKHIVEGIETNKQLRSITNIGYEVVQGYLYERPVPLAEFIEKQIKMHREAV